MRKANANASVDFPAPGWPAIMLTSDRRRMIWLSSNVLNTGGHGSPPMSGLPTDLVNVFMNLFSYKLCVCRRYSLF